MRTGTVSKYRPYLDTLEDRTVPDAVQLPGTDVVPLIDIAEAAPVVQIDVLVAGGPQTQGRSDSLTMAVITEAYPMPPGTHQPGVPAAEPFVRDPSGVFTVVVQRRR